MIVLDALDKPPLPARAVHDGHPMLATAMEVGHGVSVHYACSFRPLTSPEIRAK